MIQTGLTYFVCFFCFIEVTMIGTELLNIFEKYHIDAGQSKQVEQILKEHPSLTVEKQKNGCKASKINACSRFLFRNDMCYCAIFFTLW